MDALQSNFTCPEMRDACNGTACPQHETCAHYPLTPTTHQKEEVEEGSLHAAIIAVSEHRRIVDYLSTELELCEDVPDGIISILTLLSSDLDRTCNSLCAIKADLDKAQPTQ